MTSPGDFQGRLERLRREARRARRGRTIERLAILVALAVILVVAAIAVLESCESERKAGAAEAGPVPPVPGPAAPPLFLAPAAYYSASPVYHPGTRPAAGATLMRVSAYCPCSICCGPKACGITASGTRADHPLAAAPPEIPFAAVLTIPGYGRVRVEDRGGAIRGNRLDVLFPTHAEARAWGVRYLEVTR